MATALTMSDLSTSLIITLTMAIIWLVILEGLLSADNALVLAVMVRHLPKEQHGKALRYGLIGAFVFRVIAIALSAILLEFWFVEVFGGLYLLFLFLRHFLSRSHEEEHGVKKIKAGFWRTVIAVEFTDIVFSIDSILTAVATARQLPEAIQDREILGIEMWMWVVFLGGVLGIVTMRFVAGGFIKLLDRYSLLEHGAYMLVGWIGLSLIGMGLHHGLHHPDTVAAPAWHAYLPNWAFSIPLEMNPWVFYSGMFLILGGCLVLSRPRKSTEVSHEAILHEMEDDLKS